MEGDRDRKREIELHVYIYIKRERIAGYSEVGYNTVVGLYRGYNGGGGVRVHADPSLLIVIELNYVGCWCARYNTQLTIDLASPTLVFRYFPTSENAGVVASFQLLC